MNGDVRGIVVLTSGWALRMARAHSRLLGTDCKHDTSAGRSMWSSARAATPKGWVPTVAWIAPTEDTELIQSALLVLADNVACHDPSCNHAVQIEWGQHGHPGSYRRRRVCRRWYQPRLCCDKHVPTLKAAEMAGYGDPIFDGYHSYHCVGDQLRKIGLQGEAACEVSWLFRLWTRSMTDEQAVSMRRHVVSHMLDRIAANSPPWTLEQALQFIDYFDKCWHLPPLIRDAQIDKCRLSLDADLAPSTGANEGDHRWFDEHFFNCQINRDVTTVVMNTAGMASNGQLIRGYFDSAEQRFAHRQPSVSVDVRLCNARAAFEFLTEWTAFTTNEEPDADGVFRPWSMRLDFFADEAVIAQQHVRGNRRHLRPSARVRSRGSAAGDGESFFVRHFVHSHCLKRHEDHSLHSFNRMPEILEPVRRELKHGGSLSFTQDGFYAIHGATGRCECMASTYHGVRSAFGACKHERFLKLVCQMRSSGSVDEAEAIVQGAWDDLRQLVYHREKSKPELVRCQELYKYASDKRHHWSNYETLLEALGTNDSVPPTGKSTGLPEDEEHEQLLQANAAQHSSSETHSCIFTSDDLGLVFVPCGLFGVQVVACMKRRDGSPGPAPHTGSALSPGDLVTRIDGVADLSRCVEKSGKLSLAIAPPITLHFKRSWRHVGDESSESHIDDAAVPAGGTWKDGDVYIVESILKSRQADESTEYLCKWEGWSDEYNSWEPEANILDELLIEDYLRRTGKERPEPMSDSSEDLMEEAVTQPTMKAAATGRPAKRKPKFPSQRPAGAPRRRGKKPCRRRPDDFPMLDVPAASLSMRERAALCKERLLAESEDEVLAAQERVDSMTYVE
jgi:hypothetical protein